MGTAAKGVPLAYNFYTIKAGEFVVSKKMTVLK